MANLPKYRLVIVDKRSKNRTIAGVAFESEYGFNLVFGPGVVIDRQTIENCYFNLNSVEEIPSRPRRDSTGKIGTGKIGKRLSIDDVLYASRTEPDGGYDEFDDVEDPSDVIS